MSKPETPKGAGINRKAETASRKPPQFDKGQSQSRDLDGARRLWQPQQVTAETRPGKGVKVVTLGESLRPDPELMALKAEIESDPIAAMVRGALGIKEKESMKETTTTFKEGQNDTTAPTGNYVKPSRAGKSLLSVWIAPEYKKKLRAIQVSSLDKTFQDLLVEALDDLFEKYDVPDAGNQEPRPVLKGRRAVNSPRQS